MIRRALLGLLALCFASAALGQTYQPGRAPGFRPGFQFLSAEVVAAATTWSDTDKTSGMSVSADKLTATVSTGGPTAAIRGTSYRGSGKYYLEMKMTVGNANSIGLANANWIRNNFPGNDADAISYSQGSVFYNGASQTTGKANNTQGLFVGIAIDLDARTIDWYVSNTIQFRSTTIPTGPLTPAFGQNSTNVAVALNTGQSPFAYTPPSGFSAWQ